jgi:hypothetical protein
MQRDTPPAADQPDHDQKAIENAPTVQNIGTQGLQALFGGQGVCAWPPLGPNRSRKTVR